MSETGEAPSHITQHRRHAVQAERAERDQSEIVFVTESSPGYPYAGFIKPGEIKNSTNANLTDSESGNNNYSSREFKIRKIREAGSKLSGLFDLGKRGDLLEVGWGGNRYFAEGVYEQAGVPIVMLDSLAATHGEYFPDSAEISDRIKIPPENAMRDGKVELYGGDIIDLESIPVVNDRRFGTIIFNGSLFGSGMNWTVQQKAMDELGRMGGKWQDSAEALDSHLDQVLLTIKERLTNRGILIITSDRFSLYTAAREDKELPEEKLQFLNLIAKAIALKAKRITVIGMTKDGIRANYPHELSTSTMEQLTNDVKDLSSDINSDYLSADRIEEIKKQTFSIAPPELGMIDALGIEF